MICTLFLKLSASTSVEETKTLNFMEDIYFINHIPQKFQANYKSFTKNLDTIKNTIKNDQKSKRGIYSPIIAKTNDEFSRFSNEWLGTLSSLCLETKRILETIQEREDSIQVNTVKSCLNSVSELNTKLCVESSKIITETMWDPASKKTKSVVNLLKQLGSFEKCVDHEYNRFISYFARKKDILTEFLVSKYRKHIAKTVKIKTRREYFLDIILSNIDTELRSIIKKDGILKLSDGFMLENKQIYDFYVRLNFFNTVSHKILFHEILDLTSECSVEFLNLENNSLFITFCKQILERYVDKTLKHCKKYLDSIFHDLNCALKFDKVIEKARTTTYKQLKKFENILMLECANLYDHETSLNVLEESYINFSESLMSEYRDCIQEFEVMIIRDLSSCVHEYRSDMANIVHDDYCDYLLADILSLKAIFIIGTHVSGNDYFKNTKNDNSEYSIFLNALSIGFSLDIQRCTLRLSEIREKCLDDYSCMNIEMLYYISTQLFNICEMYESTSQLYEISVNNEMNKFMKHVSAFQNICKERYDKMVDRRRLLNKDLYPVYEDTSVILKLGETYSTCEKLSKSVLYTYLQLFQAHFEFLNDEKNIVVVCKMIKTWTRLNRDVAYDSKFIADFVFSQQFYKVFVCFDYETGKIKKSLKSLKLDSQITGVLYASRNASKELKNIKSNPSGKSAVFCPRRLEFFDFDLGLSTIEEEEKIFYENSMCEFKAGYSNTESKPGASENIQDADSNIKFREKPSDDQFYEKSKEEPEGRTIYTEDEIPSTSKNVKEHSRSKIPFKKVVLRGSKSSLDKIKTNDNSEILSDNYKPKTTLEYNFTGVTADKIRFLSKSFENVSQTINDNDCSYIIRKLTHSLPNLRNFECRNIQYNDANRFYNLYKSHADIYGKIKEEERAVRIEIKKIDSDNEKLLVTCDDSEILPKSRENVQGSIETSDNDISINDSSLLSIKDRIESKYTPKIIKDSKKSVGLYTNDKNVSIATKDNQSQNNVEREPITDIEDSELTLKNRKHSKDIIKPHASNNSHKIAYEDPSDAGFLNIIQTQQAPKFNNKKKTKIPISTSRNSKKKICFGSENSLKDSITLQRSYNDIKNQENANLSPQTTSNNDNRAKITKLDSKTPYLVANNNKLVAHDTNHIDESEPIIEADIKLIDSISDSENYTSLHLENSKISSNCNINELKETQTIVGTLPTPESLRKNGYLSQKDDFSNKSTQNMVKYRLINDASSSSSPTRNCFIDIMLDSNGLVFVPQYQTLFTCDFNALPILFKQEYNILCAYVNNYESTGSTFNHSRRDLRIHDTTNRNYRNFKNNDAKVDARSLFTSNELKEVDKDDVIKTSKQKRIMARNPQCHSYLKPNQTQYVIEEIVESEDLTQPKLSISLPLSSNNEISYLEKQVETLRNISTAKKATNLEKRDYARKTLHFEQIRSATNSERVVSNCTANGNKKSSSKAKYLAVDKRIDKSQSKGVLSNTNRNRKLDNYETINSSSIKGNQTHNEGKNLNLVNAEKYKKYTLDRKHIVFFIGSFVLMGAAIYAILLSKNTNVGNKL